MDVFDILVIFLSDAFFRVRFDASQPIVWRPINPANVSKGPACRFSGGIDEGIESGHNHKGQDRCQGKAEYNGTCH